MFLIVFDWCDADLTTLVPPRVTCMSTLHVPFECDTRLTSENSACNQEEEEQEEGQEKVKEEEEAHNKSKKKKTHFINRIWHKNKINAGPSLHQI